MLDSLLTVTGIFVFSPTPSIIPIPWWLVAVWLAFLGTFRHSRAFVLDKPLLSAALGAIFAPISYFAGMRLGAVEFGKDWLTTAAVLSIAWAVVMPIFVVVNRWLSGRVLVVGGGPG